MKLAGVVKSNIYIHGNAEEIFAKNGLFRIFNSSILDLYSNEIAPSNNYLRHIEDLFILGSFFSKTTYSQPRKEELNNFSYSSLETISESFWGDFFALAFNLSGNRLKIYKNLICGNSIFYAENQDAVLFSTDFHLLRQTRRQQNINISYLGNYILNGNHVSEQTPIEEIYELPGNSSIEFLMSRKDGFIENISTLSICPSEDEDLIERLCRVEKCLFQDAQHILLDFSGGLDSSTILLSLNQIFGAKKKIYCLNYFHSQSGFSNERTFAKHLTSKLKLPLLEIDLSNHLPFTPFQTGSGQLLNKPSPVMVFFNSEKYISQLSEKYGIDTFVSGHGGDQVFLGPPPEQILSDYFLKQGGEGLMSKMHSYASYYKRPYTHLIYPLVRDVLCYYLRIGIPNDSNHRIPSWINSDLCKKSKATKFAPKERLLPGKFFHFSSIMDAIEKIGEPIRGEGEPFHYPLLSQPMIELAFSLPSYRFLKNNNDRFLFRESAYRAYKEKNLWRPTKGVMTGAYFSAIKHNKNTIQKICLEGFCAKMGLVKSSTLEATLNRIYRGFPCDLWPLINLLSLELYLESWK